MINCTRPALPLRPNPLRWVISGLLLTPALSHGQALIQPAPGPSGSAVIDSSRPTPVIDIVAPTPAGLSHNLFERYSVGEPGVVLNNSLHAGESQLAGHLQPNRQFQNRAANMILNEVISRDASNILGPQEIFGQAADYVLANPNGIYLNGASFINAPRASFVVGSPEFDNGHLSHLNTQQADGLLELGMKKLLSEHGAIALIAPRIEGTGDLHTLGDLDIVAGHNRVRYADNAVVDVAQRSPAEQRYDASLFGAMRAGRIRIVSTGEGAGIRLNVPGIKAAEGVQVSSAGEVELIGRALDGEPLARIESGQGSLDLRSAQDMRLAGIDASGRQIKLRSDKNLYIDAVARESIDTTQDDWKNKAWFVTTETYASEATTHKRITTGSHFNAEQDVHLEAGQDVSLQGVSARAGAELHVRAGRNLRVDAAIDRTQETETTAHRKHLWRQDTQRDDITETAEISLLSGNKVALHSGDTMLIRGAYIRSAEDMTLQARQVDIDTVALADSKSSRSYRGDLVSGSFFGDRALDGDQGVSHTGSEIEAGGKLTIRTDQLTVRGSNVTGQGDAQLISDQQGVFIESVENIRKVSSNTDSSKIFGLLGSASESQREDLTHTGSTVDSRSNLKVTSPQTLKVSGSSLSAADRLDLQAGGEVVIEAAQDRTDDKRQQTDKGFIAFAGETKQAEDGQAGSKQYEAGVAWEKRTQSTHDTQGKLQRSKVTGGSVHVDTGVLIVDSADVISTQGDIDIAAQSVAMRSTDVQSANQRTLSTTGGGMYVQAGMDRVGSASKGYQQSEQRQERGSKAEVSRLGSAGNLRIDLGDGQYASEGAIIDAPGTFSLTAGGVDNRAVHDTHSQSTQRTHWRADAGMSIEYKDITRPWEKVANGQEQTRFQQNGVEDAMDPPSLGIDLQASHQRRSAHASDSTARPAQVSAGAVEQRVRGVLNDEGTRYDAHLGKVDIAAAEHRLRAAKNTQSQSLERLDVDASLRVDTVTTTDINVKALGVGSSLKQSGHNETAVPGSLTAKRGIAVQLGSDGTYEGTAFDGGEGDVVLASRGSLSIPQANDRQSAGVQSLGGFGLAKVSTTPGAGKGANLMGKLDHSESHTQDSQARIAQIDAQGKVRVTSDGDMRLEGTRIGSPAHQPADVQLRAGGKVQVLASSDTHQASGQSMGGALQLGASANPTAGGKGGSLGGAFTASRTDEQSETRQGASLQSRDSVHIASTADDQQAIHLEGLQASSKALQLDAEKGSVLIESARSTDRRDNLAVAAGAGINAKRHPTDAGSNTSGVYGRVKVDLERLDSNTHANAQLQADTLAFSSGGDTRLSGGNLDGRVVGGQVGGDLHVESLQDKVDGLALNVDLKLSKEKNPQGLVNGVTSVAGPLGGKVNDAVGSKLSKVDPNLTPTLRLNVVEQQRSTAAQAAAVSASERLDLNVAGNTSLNGATLSAPGTIDVSAARLTTTDLHGADYRAEAGLNGSTSPLDLVSGVRESLGKGTENGANLGLVRGGGHNQEQVLKGGVIQR